MTIGRTGLGARGRSAGFSFMREGDEGGGNSGGKPPEGVTETDEDEDSAGDDDEDDEDDDSEDDDDDEPLKDGGKKALQRERERNRELRRQLRALREKGGGGDGDGKGGGNDSDADVEAKASERALELAKPVVIRSTASAALKEAGLLGDASKAIRLLDFNSIDVEIDAKTGEVEIDGLDDQIEELKEDFPHLFETKRKTAGRIDGAEKKNSTQPKAKSATERQAELLTRGRRSA